MTAAVQGAPAMAAVVDGASESFVNKVTSLPVVASTLNQMYSAYNWTKGSSYVVRYTLEMAEKSVSVATNTTRPVVDRLEKPISMANYLACKQLDKIQENLPIISEPTEKVVSTIQDNTWYVIENTKKAGSEQVDNLLNTRVGKVVTLGLDMALDATNIVIEYCFPPDEEERKDLDENETDEEELSPEKQKLKEPSPSTASIQKMGKVSSKLRRRLYRRTFKNIQYMYAQKRSSDTVEKLQFTVSLTDYAKSCIDGASSAIRSRVGTTQITLWTTWNNWTTKEWKEYHGENAGNENVESKTAVERTLVIPGNLAGRLRILSHNVASSVRILPQHLRIQVEEARDLADSVYKTFEEVQYIKDLPTNLLTRAKEELDSLQETTKFLANYLMNSRPLHWLVLNQVVGMVIGRIELEYTTGSDENDVDLSNNSNGL